MGDFDRVCCFLRVFLLGPFWVVIAPTVTGGMGVEVVDEAWDWITLGSNP